MTILTSPPQVTFDPTKPEHVSAFHMLTVQRKQHPTLRFILEPGFDHIPEMMTRKMSDAEDTSLATVMLLRKYFAPTLQVSEKL